MKKFFILLLLVISTHIEAVQSQNHQSATMEELQAQTDEIKSLKNQIDSLSILLDCKIEKTHQECHSDCNICYDRLTNEWHRLLICFSLIMPLLGIIFPVLVNTQFEKRLDKQFEKYKQSAQKETEELQNKIIDKFNDQEKDIQSKINKISDIELKIESYNKESKTNRYLTQAQSIQKRQPEDAINLYSKVLESDPDNTTALVLRGIRYKVAKEYTKALNDLFKVISLDKHNVRAYNNIGSVYLRTGQYGDALKNYDKALEINPGCVAVHVNKGLLYFKQGDLDKALECYQQAILCNDESLGGHMGIRKVYAAKYKEIQNAEDNEENQKKKEMYLKILIDENRRIREIQENMPY